MCIINQFIKNHLQQQKEEDCLQMMKKFPLNNMNKCNRMTMMKIFFRREMCMILICLFINIRYLQFLFSLMSSSFILRVFLVLHDINIK
jgi:hypothetical protein